MSQENVEIVEHVYRAIAEHEAETVLALYDPDVVFDFSGSPFLGLFNRTVYRGHDGLRTMIRERYDEAWEEIFDDLEEVIDAGEHGVVGVVTTRGRGRVSSAAVQRTHAAVWTLRGGKIVRAQWFPSREAALEAVGLTE